MNETISAIGNGNIVRDFAKTECPPLLDWTLVYTEKGGSRDEIFTHSFQSEGANMNDAIIRLKFALDDEPETREAISRGQLTLVGCFQGVKRFIRGKSWLSGDILHDTEKTVYIRL